MTLLLAISFVVCACATTSADPTPRLHSSAAESRSAFRESLEAIVAELTGTFQNGGDAGEQAGEKHRSTIDAVRALAVNRPLGKQRLFLSPSLRESGDSETLSRLTDEVGDRLDRVRRHHADELWASATATLEDSDIANRVALAYQLAHEAAYVDPTHPQATHVASADSSSRDSIKAKPAKSRHKEYGWPGGSYWRIKTDHFLIVTNHSPAAGESAARVLEELHCVWRQMFAQLWLQPETLRRVMDGANLPVQRRLHKVVLFADREEYLRRLKKVEPQVAMSTGMYRDIVRTSFFYMEQPLRTDTWRHELTHQLFQEVLKADTGVAADRGFWAVEAVALYMESAQPADAFYDVGGVGARRLQFARYRALNEQFYLPIVQLTAMSKEQLQTHPEIRKLYSQAAGLAHFLFDQVDEDHSTATSDVVNDDDVEVIVKRTSPELRSGFIKYLGGLYQAGRRAPELFELTARTAASLDHGYHDFLKVNDQSLESIGEPATATGRTRDLCLGYTEVGDDGIRRLAELTRLEWLDLTACRVTDAGLESLPDDVPLRRLSLERTQITDDSCLKVANWNSLEELDLSHTAVSDTGVSELSNLQNLKSLWLTGSKITDAALPTLLQLKKLEHLNIDETAVTPGGWEELKSALPKLKSND